jgi:hypothetical protein
MNYFRVIHITPAGAGGLREVWYEQSSLFGLRIPKLVDFACKVKKSLLGE